MKQEDFDTLQLTLRRSNLAEVLAVIAGHIAQT